MASIPSLSERPNRELSIRPFLHLLASRVDADGRTLKKAHVIASPIESGQCLFSRLHHQRSPRPRPTVWRRMTARFCSPTARSPGPCSATSASTINGSTCTSSPARTSTAGTPAVDHAKNCLARFFAVRNVRSHDVSQQNVSPTAASFCSARVRDSRGAVCPNGVVRPTPPSNRSDAPLNNGCAHRDRRRRAEMSCFRHTSFRPPFGRSEILHRRDLHRPAASRWRSCVGTDRVAARSAPRATARSSRCSFRRPTSQTASRTVSRRSRRRRWSSA